MTHLLTSADAGRDARSGGDPTSSGSRLHSGAKSLTQASYLVYVAPAAAVYVLFVVVPLIKGVKLSLYEWDGVGARTWVGLANYRRVFSDPELRSAFLHSLTLIGFYSILPIVAALVLTMIVSRGRTYGLTAFRAVFFLPQIIPLVASGVIWIWIYAPNGPLNGLLSAIGFPQDSRPWLGDFTWALPSVGVIGTWVMFGLAFVFFLAGVQKIPSSLYEAARIDGAGALREFFAVTLPGLRHELIVVIVLTMITALRTFDVVYITTRGGPGFSTTVLPFEVYQQAFSFGQVGVAAALGLVLGVVILAISLVVILFGERRGAS